MWGEIIIVSHQQKHAQFVGRWFNMEEELMCCDYCGYEMEWLDECVHCGSVYCEYCGMQNTGCCKECEEDEIEECE